MTNELIIASAGSGKTTKLVEKALEKANAGESVLITTFTEACEQEIRDKLIEESKGFIPALITIQTWFSFLIQHGAKPYQDCVTDKDITGLNLISGKSALRYVTKTGHKVYWGEKNDPYNHYFSKEGKIYSDKLAKFVVRCNNDTEGRVINRLSHCFDNIFIDEVQDLAGHDLEFLKLLFDCQSNILLVGDPRQATYSTNNSQKNAKYKKSEIVNFFSDKTIEIDTDDTSLTVNYRCSEKICEYSNKIYPALPEAKTGNDTTTGHDGVFVVAKSNLDSYLNEFNPVQLRHSSKTKVNPNHPVHTYGKSKGLTFNRVLIYPTNPIYQWLENSTKKLADTSRAGLYVAMTRAKHSVCFVLSKKQIEALDSVSEYTP